MDKKILIVTITAIVAVAAIAVVITMNNAATDYDVGDKSVKTDILTSVDEFPEARLWLMGNAVQDDVIDRKDADYIADVINGKKEKNLYCDVNNDGSIDGKDLKLIKEMIDHKQTRVWYVDIDKKVCSVKCPIKKIVPTYNMNVENILVIGARDMIVATDDLTLGSETPQFTLKNIPSVGSRFKPDHEAILKIHGKTPFDIYFTGTRQWYDSTLEDTLGRVGVDVVRIPAWENGLAIQGIITMSWLLDLESNANRYVKWHDGIIADIQSRVGNIPESEKTRVFEDGDKRTQAKGSGDYESTLLCGANNLGKHYYQGNMYPDFDLEDVIKRDPQVVFRTSSSIYKVGNEKFNVDFEKLKTRFGSNFSGTLFVTGWEITSGPAYVVSLVLFAKMFYPEKFSDYDVVKTLQYYNDTFTNGNIDASKLTLYVSNK